jgi:hypothetical protein
LRTILASALLLLAACPMFSQSPAAAPAAAAATSHPVNFNVYYRGRVDAWQWFSAPPYTETYGYYESLLRLSVTQRLPQWDWAAEVSQAAVLGAPSDSVSPVAAQGQLGLGATYYASSNNNSEPAAAFLKQAFLRRDFDGGNPASDKNLRIGRFEFFDGLEMRQQNSTLAWLQTNRISQRLISNFGFANAQRSYDGVDGHYGVGSWDITGFAARSDQGVFNMNGNPELNVDVQYLAFTRSTQHFLLRGFGIGYHDGRTGVVKTDNRPLAARKTDHDNIRLGTYGGDFAAVAPVGIGQFDFVAWGALQNGSWGTQGDGAGAGAVEGGFQLKAPTSPWLRAGWFRSTGDGNPADNEHHTFFQILPTPRLYARMPFFNLMNDTDEFVQLIDRPTRRLALRGDVHGISLTSGKDLWYLGGGAYDNKVFGYQGRPAGGYTSLATLADISADWSATRNIDLNFYYGHATGKSVAKADYPGDPNAQFGYAEVVYRWGTPLRK